MNPLNGTARNADPEDGVRPMANAEMPTASGDTSETRPDAGPPVTGDSADDVSAATPGSESGTVEAGSAEDPTRRLTRTGAAWAAVVAALLLAVVLIVFVMQNSTAVVIHFLGWSGSLAVGMAMLIAAVTGGLLVATLGVARLTQLRVRAHRTKAKPVRA